MSESLFLKLTQGGWGDAQVRALLAFQLSREERQIDWELIDECLRFLDPNEPGLHPARKKALGRQLRERIAQPRRRSFAPRRALVLAALMALLLMLAAGAAAVMIARGTLNFTEGFDWLTPMTHQPDAQELVTQGTLAHRELEHVTIDVLEAAYDGSELRIVYKLAAKEGAVQDDGGVYFVPGAQEDGVHMCDYVRVNGQDAYFDDTYEVMGETQSEVLYYLQTNLRAWGVDVSGADTLTIGLPMLGEAVRGGQREMMAFTIPSSVPEEMLRGARLISQSAPGRSVTLRDARFSPLSGTVQVLISDMSAKQLMNDARGFGYALDAQGEKIPGSRLEGLDVLEDGGVLVTYGIMPPEAGWPQRMTLVFEMAKEPDILIGIALE